MARNYLPLPRCEMGSIPHSPGARRRRRAIARKKNRKCQRHYPEGCSAGKVQNPCLQGLLDMARRARFDHSDMRSMLRLYSAVSLAGILLATALIFFYVRKVAIDDIVDLAERSNITLAQSVL